jgi:mutator protein MutT
MHDNSRSALVWAFVLQLSLRVDVVAAVIEKNGQVLICQRKRGSRHALKWEFPGGKVEPGEQLPEALARELREELAIEAKIGDQIGRQEVQYPSGPPLRLHFFRVTEFTGEPVNTEFEQILWVPRERLPDYDFLDGDVAFVKAISA